MRLRNRVENLLFEERELAPYATKSLLSLGRVYRESSGECDLRTVFQRDVGRITHSAAFRRLQYKTQVFTCDTDDLSRTRLTHTLAVSQVARTIARSLRANEDLTEAIALAHDIGHAPFGHVGEDVLNAKMQGHGGFEHNAHGLRVVDRLECRTRSHCGLNLTYEVREGLARHHTEHDSPAALPEFCLYAQPSIEAQIVDVADAIAYRSHDLEDGLVLGLISPEDLNTNAPVLWRRCLPKDWRGMSPTEIAASAPRRLISELVLNVVNTTLGTIEGAGLETASDIRAFQRRVVGLSASVHAEDMLIGSYLSEKLYRHPDVLAQRCIAEDILSRLFDHIMEHPVEIGMIEPNDEQGIHRVACDTAASMTDRAAIRLYHSLVGAGHECQTNDGGPHCCSQAVASLTGHDSF